jgi:hypothetical protein
MSAAPVTTVFVKLLSGEMITLDVRPDITRKQFYARVWIELPEEVSPSQEYMMTLLRSSEQKEEQEEQEEQELLDDEEALHPCPDEIFFALMDTSEYDIAMSMRVFDAYDMTRPMNYLFQAREMKVRRRNKYEADISHREFFYYNEDDHTLFLEDGIQVEWVGRYEDELSIRIPDSAVPYHSIHHLVAHMVQRIPDTTKRVQSHLASSFLQEWSETTQGQLDDNEYNEQDLVAFDDDGAWPVRV